MLNNLKTDFPAISANERSLPLSIVITSLIKLQNIKTTRMRQTISLIAAITLLNFLTVSAQNSTYRSLLPEYLMDEIIGEASGETALMHIIEMGAYNHDRPASEYSGNFLETDYVIGKMKEYSLDGVKVNRYPGGSYWDGISGELWEVSPGKSKLADYRDLTAMLASGSTNTDIRAELVWIGTGSQNEIKEVDVSGKIVVSSGSPRSVLGKAMEYGAVGIISFNSPRPLKVDLAIPITGISGRGQSQGKNSFGFFLPPREGHLLRDRLIRGEKILVHAKVEAQTLDYQLEVPECVIKGTDADADEVILCAHIFEGYVKQGGNDNLSGSAAILEVARMLQTMITDGQIERPKRNIRFIWVPEYSGSIPWVNNHKDLMKKTLCNINLDMVGLNLSNSKSFLCMQRTTYGNAHYLNDVMENYYKYVGITNREGLAISGRGGFTKRIVAPSGSDDPFYFRIDDHYGASDHEVFNDPAVQVPGIMMITWPDLFYHTSQDRADKCDATQMKRTCVISAAAAYTIANADSESAALLANEVAGNASGRIGKQLTRATDMLNNSDDENFADIYKKGYSIIEAAVLNEKATMNSLNELDINTAFLKGQSDIIESIGKANLLSFKNYMKLSAQSRGLNEVVIKLNDTEIEAQKIIPTLTLLITDGDYGQGRSIQRDLADLEDKYPVEGRVDMNEILRLCNNGNYNVLQIKKMLEAQMKTGETDLLSVLNTVKGLKEKGYLSF